MARIGPAIPLNDLTLYLDASINTSYPGYGSIWYDLSGKANNFTLANTPTYDGEKFTFNGTNQYAQCINNTCGNFGTNSFTIEFVVNVLTTPASYQPICMKRFNALESAFGDPYPGWQVLNPNNRIFILAGATPDKSGTTFSPAPTIGNVYHTVHTVDRSNGGANNVLKTYSNGIEKNSVNSTFTTNFTLDNTQTMRLMWNSGEGAFTNADLYFIRIWNRALTPSEVGTNWDIARNKYGI